VCEVYICWWGLGPRWVLVRNYHVDKLKAVWKKRKKRISIKGYRLVDVTCYNGRRCELKYLLVLREPKQVPFAAFWFETDTFSELQVIWVNNWVFKSLLDTQAINEWVGQKRREAICILR